MSSNTLNNHKRTHRCPMKPGRAFTLVELLVVVAIIALLISILLPALNRARSTAQDVVCVTNLKQLGLSVNMYQADNADAFPLAVTDELFWDRQVAEYMSIEPIRDGKVVEFSDKGARMFLCPRDWRVGQVDWGNRLRSYVPIVYGGLANRPAHGVFHDFRAVIDKVTIRASDVVRPSETVSLTEWHIVNSDFSNGNKLWTNNFGYLRGWLGPTSWPAKPTIEGTSFTGEAYHNSTSISMLFVDGHASLEDPHEAYSNKNRRWWDRTNGVRY